MLNRLSRKDIELLNILAQTPEGKSALNEYIEQHEKAVKAYKIYRESVVVEVEVKSPNELRAEVIQRAKGVLEEWIDDVTYCRGQHLKFYCNRYLPSPYSSWGLIAEFVVNTEKHTIVALLKGFETLEIATKGIAKCHPDDVFNEHIGKAIALGRALGKDVSEFENAVQPTIAVGQRFKVTEEGSVYLKEGEILRLIDDAGFEKLFGTPFTQTIGDKLLGAKQVTIIDDTNAIYGGVE